MRRRGPRRLADALDVVAEQSAPLTLLARVQARWPSIAGPAVAGEAEPSAEREGVVTISCHSSVWAAELELLKGDLLPRLNNALNEEGAGLTVRALRFVVSRSPSP